MNEHETPGQSHPRRGVYIREIAPDCESEIELVARRMRETLVEVEGEEVGGSLYTMDWLRERVRWHLDPLTAVAKVYLAIDADQQVLGHTIVRRETDEAGRPFGLFSTTYVLPSARRRGVARLLLAAGEDWMRQQGLPRAATWTSETNVRLINLYRSHGYSQTARDVHEVTATWMVRLEKTLSPEERGASSAAG
jgi:GNAT superfamily N-acetyltransferase